jgi:hypothetical protein
LTWVLLILVTSGVPAAHAVTTISGYATEQDCKAAGQQIFQQASGDLSIRVFCVPGPSGK